MTMRAVVDRTVDQPASDHPTPGFAGLDRLAIVCSVVLAIIGAFAVHRLFRPPWVDEITTIWEIEGDLGDVLSRHFAYESNGPVFSVCMWIWSNIAGNSVLALRIPSLVACALTLLVVFRFARDFDGRPTAWLATTLLAFYAAIFAAANDARPYALALLAATIANTEAIRWAQSGRRRHGMTAAIAAALALNLHLLTGFGLLGLPFVAGKGLARGTVRFRDAVQAALVGALFLVPLIPQFLTNVSNASRFDAETSVDWVMPIVTALPPPLLLAGVAAIIVSRTLDRRTGLERWQVNSLIVWMSLGIAIPYLLARYLGVDVFLPRYTVWALPPAAVLSAAGIARLRRPSAAIVAVIAGFALVLPVRLHLMDEAGGWDEAVAWVNSSTPRSDTVVILEPMHTMGKDYAFFGDSTTGPWRFDPSDDKDWVNPLEAAHPVDPPLYGLPWAADTWGQDYLDVLIDERVNGTEVIVLIGRDGRPEVNYEPQLTSKLSELGYREVSGPDIDREVVVFVRQNG